MSSTSEQALSSGGPPRTTIDQDGLCLLSLDGGGVRGLSTLHVLKIIMDNLNTGVPPHERKKPCDIFDMIAGTSTGGLIAIMLGRLEMDVDECIAAYVKLMATVFEKRYNTLPVNWFWNIQPLFDSEKLRVAVEEVVKSCGRSPDDLFDDGTERGCKVFVCSASKDLDAGITRIRSYSHPNELAIPATICQAALATSAATGFFNSVTIGTRKFVDGAKGANNPVDEIEGEASDIWCPRTAKLQPLVKCFLSIGTGNPGKKAIEDGAIKFLKETLVRMTTETERTAEKFIGRWRDQHEHNRYFRFNVEQGLHDVGLEEYKAQGTIEAATEQYLKHQAQKLGIRRCVENLKMKQGLVGNFDLDAFINLSNPRRIGILRDLSAAVYEDQKNRNPRRVEGTCEWFTHHKLFDNWWSKRSGLLWVSADPGCGKSVLARYLVDDVLPSTNIRTTCYFFFKDDFQEQKTAENAIRCILRQLFDEDVTLLTDIVMNRLELGGAEMLSSFGSLWQILLEVSTANAAKGREVICVLDALDECEERGRSMLASALTELYSSGTNMNTCTLRFLLTSRPDVYLRRDLQTLKDQQPTIHLRGDDEGEAEKISSEIDLVIKKQVEDLSRELRLSSQEGQVLETSLTSVGNRTYLWLHLVLQDIRKSVKVTMRDMRAFIAKLPRTVEEAYDKILNKSHDPIKTKKLLHIVLAATRPLSLLEIGMALAIQEKDRLWQDVKLEPEERSLETIRAICGHFVVIIDSRVYLIHQTAREFLVQSSPDLNPESTASTPVLEWKHKLIPAESHCLLAEICIWYLHPFDYRTKHNGWDLMNYAANNWTTHYRLGNVQSGSATERLARELCAKRQEESWLEHHLESKVVFECFFNHLTPLLVASFFGLERLVEIFMREKQANMYHPCFRNGRTGLIYACIHGHEAVVRILVAQIPKPALIFANSSTIVNTADRDGRTPLHYAAANGHENIVKMLLNKGAKMTLMDCGGFTPKELAQFNQHQGVVDILTTQGNTHAAGKCVSILGGLMNLRWPTRAKQPNPDSETALLDRVLKVALNSRNEYDIKLALRRGGDVNTSTSFGTTPLLFAAEKDNADLLRLILSRSDVDIYVRDMSNKDALEYAVQYGSPSIVEPLLARGAYGTHKVNRFGKTGRNILGFLVSLPGRGLKHLVIARLLIDAGASLDWRDDKGRTLLMTLSICGGSPCDVDIARLLLKRGPDVECRDDYGFTALSHLVQNYESHVHKKPWWSEMMRVLVHEGGADTQATDNEGNTPLILAVKGAPESALCCHYRYSYPEDGGSIGVLLEKGANIEARSSEGRTALWCAVMKAVKTECCEGYLIITKFLLDQGADVEAGDNNNRTLLSWAVTRNVGVRKRRKQIYRSIIELLLDRGADVEPKDNEAKTPLDWAKEKGTPEVVELLEAHMHRKRMGNGVV